jgi:hypothetical protein
MFLTAARKDHPNNKLAITSPECYTGKGERALSIRAAVLIVARNEGNLHVETNTYLLLLLARFLLLLRSINLSWLVP